MQLIRHILSISMVIAFASPCFGQFAGNPIDRGYNTPTFSPYINLLNNNRGSGIGGSAGALWGDGGDGVAHRRRSPSSTSCR